MALTAWRTFVEVCRLGSLSAAAAELGYSQSAVSRQIAALEREIGVPLLERHARGVAPTVAGEAFRGHARVAVAETDRAARAARAATGSTPRLVLGAPPSLAAAVVPAAVRRLLDETGGLTWTLVPALSTHLQELTAAGGVDLAVVTDAPPGLADDDRLARRLLGYDEMCVLVPSGHELEGRERVPLERLAEATWVEDNEGSAALLRQHAARAGFAPRIDLDAADLMGKVSMVATGHAVALVPGVLVPALRRDVVPVPISDPPRRGIYAITPRQTGHPQADRLVDLLKEELSGLSPRLDGGNSRPGPPVVGVSAPRSAAGGAGGRGC